MAGARADDEEEAEKQSTESERFGSSEEEEIQRSEEELRFQTRQRSFHELFLGAAVAHFERGRTEQFVRAVFPQTRPFSAAFARRLDDFCQPSEEAGMMAALRVPAHIQLRLVSVPPSLALTDHMPPSYEPHSQQQQPISLRPALVSTNQKPVLENPAFVLELPRMESTVSKKSSSSNWLASWKEKELLLSWPKGLELRKKKKPPMNAAKTVGLEDIYSVAAAPRDIDHTKEHCFLLNTNEKTWIISCPTQQLMNAWMKSISTYCFLHALVFKKNLSAVKRFVKSGADVNRDAIVRKPANNDNTQVLPVYTPLLLAANFLLSSKREQEVPDKKTKTVLESFFPFLLSNNANPACLLRLCHIVHEPLAANYTALTPAKVLDIFISNKICFGVVADDEYQWSILMHICYACDISSAEIFLSQLALSCHENRNEGVDFIDEIICYSNSKGDTAISILLKQDYLKAKTSYDVNNSETIALLLLNNLQDSFESDLIRACDSNGETLLHLAIKSKHLRFAERLIDRGADLTARDKDGFPALHLLLRLCSGDEEEGCERLVQNVTRLCIHALQLNRLAGSLFELRDRSGNDTLLTLAIKQRHIPICICLLEFGANANVEGSIWRSDGLDHEHNKNMFIRPIHVSIRMGLIEVAEALVAFGSSLNIPDETGLYPIELALYFGMYALVYQIQSSLLQDRTFIEGIDLNALIATTFRIGQIELGFILLDFFEICYYNNAKFDMKGLKENSLICYILLQWDRKLSFIDRQYSDIGQSSNILNTQLRTNSESSLIDETISLSDDKVQREDTYENNLQNYSTHQYIVFCKQLIYELLLELLKRKNTVDCYSSFPDSCIQTDIFPEIFRDSGSLFFYRNETPISLAARFCRDSSMQLFNLFLVHLSNMESWQSCSIFLKFSEYDGNSLLQLLVLSNSVKGVRDLLTAIEMASPHSSYMFLNHVNNEGNTALHLAVKLNSVPIVRILVNKGSYLGAWDKGGYCALHLMIISRNYSMMKLLNYSKHVDFNIRTEEGLTPIMLAVLYDDLHSLKFLLKNNADVGLCTPNKRDTILHMALQSGVSADFATLLLQQHDLLQSQIVNHTGLYAQDITKSLQKIASEAIVLEKEVSKHLPQNSRSSLPTLSRNTLVMKNKCSYRHSLPQSPMDINGGSLSPVFIDELASKKVSYERESEHSILQHKIPKHPGKFGEKFFLKNTKDEKTFLFNNFQEQENSTLQLVAYEARIMASEWLQKRVGKRKLLSDALVLIQNSEINNGHPLSESEALEEVKKKFIAEHVAEAVENYRREIQEEKMTILKEFGIKEEFVNASVSDYLNNLQINIFPSGISQQLNVERHSDFSAVDPKNSVSETRNTFC